MRLVIWEPSRPLWRHCNVARRVNTLVCFRPTMHTRSCLNLWTNYDYGYDDYYYNWWKIGKIMQRHESLMIINRCHTGRRYKQILKTINQITENHYNNFYGFPCFNFKSYSPEPSFRKFHQIFDLQHSKKPFIHVKYEILDEMQAINYCIHFCMIEVICLFFSRNLFLTPPPTPHTN